MKHISVIALSALAFVSCAQPKQETSVVGLKDVFKDKFYVGCAVNQWQAIGDAGIMEDSLIKTHFNSVVAENVMKCEVIHPAEGVYDFKLADEFMDYAEKNNMHVVGHCLIWHSQCAPWFHVDSLGNLVDAETLKARMKEHITTIVTRYKGRVDGWDVVNEAIESDGSWRKSLFYEILGEEYIELAFRYAHEADPDVELYYNDYGMNDAGRRATVVKMVNDFKAKGVRIDAIGMQSHIGLDYPNLKDYEESIEAFAATGCKVMITELDMSALPTINRTANVADTVAFQQMLNPYPVELPDSVSSVWNARMQQVFDIYTKHSDKISRVTAWGVQDGNSWKNDWPMKGRHDYPLLFTRGGEAKPFLQKYYDSQNK